MSATPQQVEAVLQAAAAIRDAIQALGEVPSGHLYARVMEHMSLATYERLIGMLIEAKLVKRENHLLTWIGPARNGGK